MARVFNFNSGPATLPEAVLKEAQAELLDFKGSGMSILEHSHRGKFYDAVHSEAVANVSRLLGLGDEHAVLFVPGGASMQFAMLPINLLAPGCVADYINSGTWAAKAVKEAKTVGKVNVVADTSKDIPTRMPDINSLNWTPDAAYAHITSNETIAGTQLKSFPKTQAPLVADMSSDILSRPIDARAFDVIYAGAQKNLGPSGMALVVIKKELAERCSTSIPAMLRYKTFVEENSLYNTPPCFGIYMLMLVTRWILKIGPQNLYNQNREKAALLYAAIDSSDFYRPTAITEFRSDMNVTFRLSTEELEERFVKEATAAGLAGLKGHRSVGGIRASIYNALPPEGVTTLLSFMKEFERRNG